MYYRALLPLLAATAAAALEFPLEDTTPRCFRESLPADTLVFVHYRVEQYNYTSLAWDGDVAAHALVTVSGKPNVTEEPEAVAGSAAETDYRLVSRRGASMGDVAFTTSHADEYELCFSLAESIANGWFSAAPRTRITVDLVAAAATTSIAVVAGTETVGGATALTNGDAQMHALYWRVHDLVNRVHDLRREQAVQRQWKEKEQQQQRQETGLDARVPWLVWLVMQLGVVAAACAAQRWAMTAATAVASQTAKRGA